MMKLRTTIALASACLLSACATDQPAPVATARAPAAPATSEFRTSDFAWSTAPGSARLTAFQLAGNEFGCAGPIVQADGFTVTAGERAWAELAAGPGRGRPDAELAVAAEERTRSALLLDTHDVVRYTGARVTFHSRMDVVRAQLATRLAQRERDPESTSQIIRELRSRRSVEAPDVVPPLPPAGPAAPGATAGGVQ